MLFTKKFSESRSGKSFHASGMHAIDSSPRKTSRKPVFLRNFVHFRFNTHIPSPESESGKHFHAAGMLSIDFPQKIISKGIIFRKKFMLFWISLLEEYPTPPLNFYGGGGTHCAKIQKSIF
jgi:hypothetical protein